MGEATYEIIATAFAIASTSYLCDQLDMQAPLEESLGATPHLGHA